MCISVPMCVCVCETVCVLGRARACLAETVFPVVFFCNRILLGSAITHSALKCLLSFLIIA